MKSSTALALGLVLVTLGILSSYLEKYVGENFILLNGDYTKGFLLGAGLGIILAAGVKRSQETKTQQG